MKRIVTSILRRGAEALNLSGLDALAGHRYAGNGAIIILHSVVRDRADYLYDPIRTSARYLDRLLQHFRRRNVDIVSIDEALSRLQQVDPAPFVHFTLDDGFKDNLTIALPIFERYGAPFTVFVTTAFIERRLDNWWMGAMALVKQNDTIEIPALASSLCAATLPEKISAYGHLVRLVDTGKLPLSALRAAFDKYRINLPEMLDPDALTLDELRCLSRHPLVTIGGHTTNHLPLATLPRAEARSEMLENKLWLERMLDRPVRHLAYPFGTATACGPREADLARDVGFDSAVTTRTANLFPAHAANPHALPRLRAFSEYESERLVAFQRSGAASALLSRFGNPVVTM
ncbi:MAG: polysaccharide deacetylase family protein [Hyphomicrobiaceae bacterium]